MKRKLIVVIIAVITLLCVGMWVVLQHTKNRLEGAYLLYAGGAMAGEAIYFSEDGTGMTYHERYGVELGWTDADDPILNGKPLTPEMLSEPREMQWELKDEKLKIQYTEDHYEYEFDIWFEKNLDESGLPGFALTNNIGGGGYIKVKSTLGNQ